MGMRAVAVAGLWAVVLAGLSGCAMYSETRHKQAVAAKQAWSKVDLAGQLTAARKNESALLAEQLKTEEALARASRDALASSWIVGGTVEATLMADIKTDLSSLVGIDWTRDKNAEKADTLLYALDDQLLAQRLLAKIENEFIRFGLEMPACDSAARGEADQSIAQWARAHADRGGAVVDDAWTAAKVQCDIVKTAADNVQKALGGGVFLTAGAIETTMQDLEAARKQAVNTRNSYRAASRELDVAMLALAKAANGANGGAAAAVDDAVDKLARLVQVLEKAPDAFSSRLLADARVKTLNEVIASVQDARETGKVAADASIATRILRQFPDLVDTTRTALVDAQKSRLAPLVLGKNLEKVKADAAARDVESQLAINKLVREKFRWEVERLRSLRDAYDYLSNHCEGCLGMAMKDALQPVSPEQLAKSTGQAQVQAKMNVLTSASLYLDSKGRLASSASKIEYQIYALEHERALAYAEGNVAQCGTLIGSVVDQMSDFSETGIKKEHVAGFVSAVALVLIGKGVH